MNDKTSPFAVKRYDATAEVPGCECCGPSVDFREEKNGDWVKIEDHNAAVTARERKSAAKALRSFSDSEALKDDFGHGEVITKHDVRTALRAEADSVEKGER